MDLLQIKTFSRYGKRCECRSIGYKLWAFAEGSKEGLFYLKTKIKINTRLFSIEIRSLNGSLKPYR